MKKPVLNGSVWTVIPQPFFLIKIHLENPEQNYKKETKFEKVKTEQKMPECIAFGKAKYCFVKILHTELQFLIYISTMGCSPKSLKNLWYICYLQNINT